MMSDEQIIMKFEYLPNEVFLECFEYLNAPDIFYAFEQLNHRFNLLIRSIPLRLDFQDIHESIFYRFCKKMLSNPSIQQQIYFLKLSNKDTHGQIHGFLTYFSLDQFTKLRSLTLINMKKNNEKKLISIFPLLTKLICFRLFDSDMDTDNLVSKLPISKLQILLVLPFGFTLSSLHEIMPLRKLSVDSLSFNHLYQILQYTPMLQYLCASRIREYNTMPSVDIYLLNIHVNHLKELIISDFQGDFNDLINFLTYMSNLRSLTVTAYHQSDIINAIRWEQFILSSLFYLVIFIFKFGIRNENEIIEKYKEFQNDFWIKEHQWYTECLFSKGGLSYLFTIPYLIDFEKLSLKSVRYSNQLIDNSKTFNNIKDLNLSAVELIMGKDFYFSNIQSLIIDSLPIINNKDDEEKVMKSLERMLNLSNIKHLSIPLGCRIKWPRILLRILKEAPHLSSLGICLCSSASLKMNDELCQYLKKMIRKLEFNGYSLHHYNLFILPDFIFQLFPNLEQLIVGSNVSSEKFSLLFNNLSKLSKLIIYFSSYIDCPFINRVKDQVSKLNNPLFYEDKELAYRGIDMITFYIWVNRNNMIKSSSSNTLSKISSLN